MSFNTSTLTNLLKDRFEEQARFGASADLSEVRRELVYELSGIPDDEGMPHLHAELLVTVANTGPAQASLSFRGRRVEKFFGSPQGLVEWAAEEMNLLSPDQLIQQGRFAGETRMAKSDGEWGIRWTEWKKDQRVNKEKFFSTEKARDKFIEQQEKKDNFGEWGATSNPREDKKASLRGTVAKLAADHPELRKHLIPILRRTADTETELEAGRQHGESGKGYGGETVRGPGKWEPESKDKCFYETGDEGDRCYVTQNGGPGGQKKPGPSNKPGLWKDYEGQRWEK